jgi:hypothetical protein
LDKKLASLYRNSTLRAEKCGFDGRWSVSRPDVACGGNAAHDRSAPSEGASGAATDGAGASALAGATDSEGLAGGMGFSGSADDGGGSTGGSTDRATARVYVQNLVNNIVVSEDEIVIEARAGAALAMMTGTLHRGPKPPREKFSRTS